MKVNIQYLKLISHIIHTNNCLDTNKRVHFRILLEKRGFVDASKNIKTKKNTLTKEEKQALKEEKIEKLDITSQDVEKKNEYLEIPEDKIKQYAELFIDQNKLQDHFNWRRFAHNLEGDVKKDIQNILAKANEFNVQKTHSNNYKILFLLNFRESVGLENKETADFYDIEPKHPIDEKIVDTLQKEYCLTFKTRAKEIDFKKLSCVNKHMMIMHKNLFGENIVNSEETGRVKVGNKRVKVYKYTINMETANTTKTSLNTHDGLTRNWKMKNVRQKNMTSYEENMRRKLPLLDTDKDEYYRKNKDWTMRRNQYLGIRPTTLDY